MFTFNRRHSAAYAAVVFCSTTIRARRKSSRGYSHSQKLQRQRAGKSPIRRH